jgi:hypothetical protein
MYDFRMIDTSKAGISECVSLLRTVFPQATHITPNYLEWQYIQNPVGQCVGFNAYAAGQLAAHYVTIPISARLFGLEKRGLLSLNTATHPEHQGRRLFTTLAAKTYEYGRSAGYDFVVGVANANSTPGFVGKLNFQLVAPLMARVGVGMVKKKQTPVHNCFECLWDAPRLNWRMQNPSLAYTYRQVNQMTQILASTGKFNIQAVLGEFVTNQYAPQLFARQRTFPYPIKLWIGLDCQVDWKKSLYMDIPERFKPSPLNLIFKDLTEKMSPLSPDQVIFHAIDFDAY